jgi:S1-C subfamily serine protease
MRKFIRTPFVSAVLGGVAVAATFMALGVTGRRATQTVVEQAPVAAQPASDADAALTPHAIYLRDAPGVVFVRSQIVQTVEDPFDLYPQQQRSEATGSGFLIDNSGRILTNYHVVEGADLKTGVTVQFEDNVVRHARVVGQDPNNDLALLKVDLDGVAVARPLALGDSSTVQVGDPTLAIGNPFGLDRTLTSGIVSALQRQIQAPNGFSIDDVIQTDAPINPGNSGGPLIDAAGRVIGINSQIATGTDGNGSVGIGFAVPINTAKQVLLRLEQGGQVAIAYLGVAGVAVNGPRSGVRITRAQKGGPADRAGLRTGDRIALADGHRIATMNDLQEIVAAKAPGDSLALVGYRGTKPERFTVTLGNRPTTAPMQ